MNDLSIQKCLHSVPSDKAGSQWFVIWQSNNHEMDLLLQPCVQATDEWIDSTRFSSPARTMGNSSFLLLKPRSHKRYLANIELPNGKYSILWEVYSWFGEQYISFPKWHGKISHIKEGKYLWQLVFQLLLPIWQILPPLGCFCLET